MTETNDALGWSVHFQLVVVGTVLFLVALFWPFVHVNHAWSDAEELRCVWNAIWSIGGYLAFVVLIAGHALETYLRRSKSS